MRNARSTSLFLLASSMAVIACSSKQEATTPAPTGGGEPVHIIATDSVYLAPDTLKSGWTHVVFENHGTTIHEVMFIQLPDGMTAENYAAAVRGGADFPEGAKDCSGVGLTSPGGKAELWVELDPGRYLLGCWYRRHLAERPVRAVVVSNEPSGVTPPTADATLKLVDFRFELVGALERGDPVLKVDMLGPSMHEFDIFRLNEGKTVDDVKAWQKAHKPDPVPLVAVGGALDSHEIGRTVWFRTRLEPGRYVIWCGMDMVPGATGAAAEVTHADAGMFKEFEIEE